MLSLKPRPFVLCSFVLRYAGAPITTRVFIPFVYLEMSLFFSIFCTIAVFSLYGDYVVRCLGCSALDAGLSFGRRGLVYTIGIMGGWY